MRYVYLHTYFENWSSEVPQVGILSRDMGTGDTTQGVAAELRANNFTYVLTIHLGTKIQIICCFIYHQLP